MRRAGLALEICEEQLIRDAGDLFGADPLRRADALAEVVFAIDPAKVAA